MTYQEAYERVRRLSGIGSGDVATATAKSVLLDASRLVHWEIANKNPSLVFIERTLTWIANTDYLDAVVPACGPIRILSLCWRSAETSPWVPCSPLGPTEMDKRTVNLQSEKLTYFYTTNIIRTYLYPKPKQTLYMRAFEIYPWIEPPLDADPLLTRGESDGATRTRSPVITAHDMLAVVRAAYEIRLQEGRPTGGLMELMQRYEMALFGYTSVQLHTTGHIPNRNVMD